MRLVRAQHVFYLPASLGWVRLSHVFHYWRAIALGTPDLWSSIAVDGRGPDRMRDWLARSGQGPLEIAVGTTDEDDGLNRLDEYALVMNEFSRIRKLDVVLSEAYMHAVQWNDSVALALETLHLEISFPVPEVPEALWDYPHVSTFPNLTDLSLTNIRDVWGFERLPPSLSSSESSSIAPSLERERPVSETRRARLASCLTL